MGGFVHAVRNRVARHMPCGIHAVDAKQTSIHLEFSDARAA